MSASFSNNFDNKEDSPLINALSRHIGEYYKKIDYYGRDREVEDVKDNGDKVCTGDSQITQTQ